MFSRILVPVDMSSPEAGARSLPRAREMTDAWGSEIHLLTVLPGYSMPMIATYFPANALEKMSENVHKELAELSLKHFSEAPQITVRTGKRAKEILSLADEWAADLIIFGCRPKDVLGGELMLGSCGLTVAERAKCNVLIAR